MYFHFGKKMVAAQNPFLVRLWACFLRFYTVWAKGARSVANIFYTKIMNYFFVLN